MVPSSATSSVLQKMVGQPSFSMMGWANCSNVSLMMITWVCARRSSRNSLAPGTGWMSAMTSWICGRPMP